MPINRPSGRQSFVVDQTRDWITMVLIDHSPGDALGCTVELDVWNATMAVLSAENRAAQARLTSLKPDHGGDGLPRVSVNEHVMSAFWLMTLFEHIQSCERAAEIARSWTKLPLAVRKRWWQQATSDAAVHAQLLGLGFPGACCLESVVPDWLPKLAGLTRQSQVSRHRWVRWTFARTDLGASCIAWMDDDKMESQACLAISDCAVRFSRANDPDLALAKRAIEMLNDTLRVMIGNPELANLVAWQATGHELLEIESTLMVWMDRLEAVANLGAVAGLSTMQMWERIGNRDSDRAA